MKDIACLYKDIKISSNSEIIYDKNVLQLYEITPINIIEKSNILKERIYNAYYTCVKGMPSRFQILVLKQEMDMSQLVYKMEERAKRVQSCNLKNAIKMYADNLDKICKKADTKAPKFYIVAPIKENLDLVFSSLKNFGLSVSRVNNVSVVEKVMNKSILKEVL